MATKKRSRGRPKLTVAEKRQRDQQTKVSIMMNPYQLAILESWIDDQEILEGRGFSRAQAVLHLTMSHLIKGLSKDERDKIVQAWTKRASKR